MRVRVSFGSRRVNVLLTLWSEHTLLFSKEGRTVLPHQGANFTRLTLGPNELHSSPRGKFKTASGFRFRQQVFDHVINFEILWSDHNESRVTCQRINTQFNLLIFCWQIYVKHSNSYPTYERAFSCLYVPTYIMSFNKLIQQNMIQIKSQIINRNPTSRRFSSFTAITWTRCRFYESPLRPKISTNIYLSQRYREKQNPKLCTEKNNQTTRDKFKYWIMCPKSNKI
jgi:hypothetical protein